MRIHTLVTMLAGLLLVALCQRVVGQTASKLARPTIILAVDPSSNSANGVLHLQDSLGKARVYLTSGDFTSRTTKKGINARTTFFAPGQDKGSQVLEVKLPPGEVLPVRFEVANVWEAGESEANVYANKDTIGTIRVLKYRLPFNVKLIAPNPDQPELAITKGTDFQLGLRNDDAMTYTVHPALWVNGHAHSAPPLVLPPNGSGAVTIHPPGGWFSRTSFLRPNQTDGQLTLRFEPPGSQADPGWPTRVIPFKARLSSVTPGWQNLSGFGYILLLLGLGGALSLLLRHWVPNSLARASLKDRLNELAEKTRMLSPRTSSEIRVGLRVERQRLIHRLRQRWTFSPELPALCTESGKRVDELLTHSRLVERLNDLRDRTDELYRKHEAPSKLLLIEQEVDGIGESLKKIPATPEELQAIDKRILATVEKITLLAQADEEWVKKLETDFTGLDAATRASLESDYPPCGALFALWTRPWKEIKTTEYDTLDACISLLELIRSEFEQLKTFASGSTTRPAAADDLDLAVQKIEFRAACKAMREIRSGVYREQVVDALKDVKRRPRVAVTQNAPRVYSPVQFVLDFPDRRLTGSDALDTILCKWHFQHDDLTEKGWRVAHFFPKEEKYCVAATFEYQGQPIEENGAPVEVIQEIVAKDPDERNPRTNAEVVQLVIVLLIALLGLMAGAREQLEKLDLLAASVAVFLLGFSADSIKNALAPPKSTPEPKAAGG